MTDHAQATPLRREPGLVKKLTEGGASRPPRRDFRRHLAGYELGMLTLGMVLTFALLALPRASQPEVLPLPRIDRDEAGRSEAQDRELIASAERRPLPFEVRAVGESIRHLGSMQAQGLDPEHDRQDLDERMRVVTTQHQLPLLLQLRALQTRFFLDAVAELERTGAQSADLTELGGDFLKHARQSGWIDERQHSLADAATLRVLYQLRWADIVQKRRAFPFAPSLNEWRIYYRFLLLHPERSATNGQIRDDEARLRLVTALARKDPDYPDGFARGLLAYRLGDSAAAAAAYRAQLGKSDSGAYALLARNYLIYALQGVSSE